jgi:hypothetical protein
VVEASRRRRRGVVEGGEVETTRRRRHGEGRRDGDGNAETARWRAATCALLCG